MARETASDSPGGAVAQKRSLKQRFDESTRSAGSKMSCPECGTTIPSQQQSDHESNIRREFPKSFSGCRRCGFNGVVFFEYGSDLNRVGQEVYEDE